jgi:beta-barrel assembly-enhancing protease
VIVKLIRNGRFYAGLGALCLIIACSGGSINVFSPGDDAELGKKMAEELYAGSADFPMLDATEYPEAYLHLNRITDKILASKHIRHRNEFAWQVHIVDNDTVLNAFCTPGGYIFVYTGLIRFLKSEDQLAGVLGHEIAHADMRHSTEQLTKTYGVRIITQLIAGESTVVGNVADQLLSLGFSRHDENEADLQSVNYLYDTDYDARGVARFFERMSETGHPGQLQFLSTHPNPENRIRNIIEHWQMLGGKTGKTFEKEYQQLIRALP